MRKTFILGIIGILLISAGILTACNNAVTTKNTTDLTNSEAATNAGAPVTTDAAKAFSVDFNSEPSEIKAGTPVTLSFTIKDRQGAAVKDLSIVHEKPMHLLVVSKDLAEFYHIHPEQQPDGSYRVSHVFPNGGDYKLYADFTPKEAAQVVERIYVKVAGTERSPVALVPDQKLEKTVDGLRVVMKPSAEIKAGEELTLDFQVFDAKTNKPATDLQNYLGELAHFVIISEDGRDFVHAHPMSKTESMGDMNGMKMNDQKADNHADDGHDRWKTESTTIKPSQSEVSAHTAFPRSGVYKLWAQFQRGDRVINVPFIVHVPEGDQPKIAKNDSAPADAIKVTVSKNGFSPSEIKAEKGYPLTLIFNRADNKGCGKEVVFSSLNIRKKLPLKKDVKIVITPTESGEIAFACGVGMMKGSIIAH
ncbi:MAG: cupredoxin domain-containing protein [Acidobacteriota bacterium]|nr:cupredoxin domain-containing protein [Acidobacteriota bacterium]